MARQVWQAEDGETFETQSEAERHEATLRRTSDDQEFDSDQKAMMQRMREGVSSRPWIGRLRVVTTPGAPPAPAVAWGVNHGMVAVDWDAKEISRVLRDMDEAPSDPMHDLMQAKVNGWIREYETWAMTTPDPAAAMADMKRQFGVALENWRERWERGEQ